MPAHYFTRVETTKDNQKVRLVFIDTSPFEKKAYKSKKMPFIPLQDTAMQRKWIDSMLANSTEAWKIVVGHHPVYSSGSALGNTDELIDMLKPMLEKYKVQAYLCGMIMICSTRSRQVVTWTIFYPAQGRR